MPFASISWCSKRIQLTEREVSFVKIQHRKNGINMVTIPIDAVHLLHLDNRKRLKVIVDVDERRLIYV